MDEKKVDLREALREYKFKFDLLQKIPCTKEENKVYAKLLKDGGTLPEGVYAYVYESGAESSDEFYTIYEPDLTEAEIAEYLTYKRLSILNTIKNCVMFFTVLTIIGMVAYVLLLWAM